VLGVLVRGAELLAVVLRSVPAARIGDVDAVQRGSIVVVDPPLALGATEACVVPVQPQRRLRPRLGSSVGDRDEVAQLDDTTEPLEPIKLQHHLLMGS
jgi:hypothetical protein